MAEALEIILAELSIDSPEKEVKKIDKVLSKLKKNLKGTEKEAGKFSKTFGKLKSPGLQRAGRGLQRVGRGARRGAGALTGGFGGIPIIGGAIAAALGAMSATRGRFIAGVSLKKELITLSNDFRSAFGKRAKSVLALVKEEGNFFREDDFRAGFTALRDAGIDPKSITKNISSITKFAKAQGFTTVTEAVQALTAGRVKAGRGLGVTQIKQIEALAPFTQDVASAGVAFERIVEILKSASPQLEKFAKKTTDATEGIVKQSNTVRDMTETTTLLGRVTKDSAGKFKSLQPIFEKTERNARISNDATAKLADATSGIVSGFIALVPEAITRAKKLFDEAGKVIKTVAGALGTTTSRLVERVAKLRGITVGEAKRQVEAKTFKKLSPAEIQAVQFGNSIKEPPKPPSAPLQKKTTASININVNITAPSDDIGNSVAKEIRKTLNLLARTTFRHNTGLILSG